MAEQSTLPTPLGDGIREALLAVKQGIAHNRPVKELFSLIDAALATPAQGVSDVREAARELSGKIADYFGITDHPEDFVDKEAEEICAAAFRRVLIAREATIAEQQKRIVGLEECVERLEADWSREECVRLQSLLGAERQRREECETALVELLRSHNNLYKARFGETSDPYADISAKAARKCVDRQGSAE